MLSFCKKIIPNKKRKIEPGTVESIYNFGQISERSIKGSKDYLTTQEARFLATNAKCPDCGNSMLAGPEGGCYQNIKCSNTDCESKFNVMAFGDGNLSGHRLC